MAKRVKITRESMGDYHYISKDLEWLLEEIKIFFEYDEVGDKISLEIIDMSEDEYKNLHEFQG